MKFVWKKSGDSLDVNITNPVVVEYWLSNLDSTYFSVKEDSIPYEKFKSFSKSLDLVNDFLVNKLNIHILNYEKIVWDQDWLNQVHADWATLQYENVNLPTLLQKLNPELLDHLYNINLSFHYFETHCNVRYIEKNSDKQFKHQMPGLNDIEKYLQHGKSHLYLPYWGLGRDYYDAWLTNDTVAHIDNFSKLPYVFDVRLTKPYTNKYPDEYIKWMQDRNLKPIGSYLPIGNFDKYQDNTGNLYELFLRNKGSEIELRI